MNYDLANSQANQISSDAVDLQHALKRMTDYKSLINANWKSQEVVYVNQAIDEVISLIKKSINDMNQLSKEIKITAADIKKEEKAAAEKLRAEKEKRIREAQDKLDLAIDELSALNDQKQYVEKQIMLFQNNEHYVHKTAMLIFELNELNSKIRVAEQNCEICLNNLNAARR